MRNVKVANLYILLTGLPVGRVEGGKVLSARFVFQVYFNWYENMTLIQSSRMIVFLLLWYSK